MLCNWRSGKLRSMAFFLLYLLFWSLSLAEIVPSSSPYLSPSTFHRNYQLMLQQFKIFAYRIPEEEKNLAFPISTSTSLFHHLLLHSLFVTTDPNQAHLFYLPISACTARSVCIARIIRNIRSAHPFWNRTLGADHFFLSHDGVGAASDRNLVELRKNSIQISPFPTSPGKFIPHKDLTLPPPLLLQSHKKSDPTDHMYLALYNGNDSPKIAPVLEEFRREPELFRIETLKKKGMDLEERAEMMKASRFCLYFYGLSDPTILGEALGSGCVPVVVSDRAAMDLPFGDVIRWSEMAVFVGLGGGEAEEIRRKMEVTCADGERYARMRELGMEASVHFRWSKGREQSDAFHMVIYELWLRRHTIRYPRREWDSE